MQTLILPRMSQFQVDITSINIEAESASLHISDKANGLEFSIQSIEIERILAFVNARIDEAIKAVKKKSR